MLYADAAVPHFAERGEVDNVCSYTRFDFDAEGRLTRVAGQLVHASGLGGISVTLDGTSSGTNLLALTGADVERLRATGATPTDIRSRFGAPTATYRSEATRVLHFSRSPTSTHYHVRAVGLDQHGRVCWKRADIHWD